MFSPIIPYGWCLRNFNEIIFNQCSIKSSMCICPIIFVELTSDFTEKMSHCLYTFPIFFSILKVGVASIEDGRRISQDYGVLVSGCVDLRNVIKRIRGIFHWY